MPVVTRRAYSWLGVHPHWAGVQVLHACPGGVPLHSGLGSMSQSRYWSSVGTPPTKPTGRRTIVTRHITAPTRRCGDALPIVPSRSGGNGA
ncbi:hypothetical protein PCANC_24308 [Puccinia coronata f. sp. avenae]|uniref:Uncharacterized protein n=1 Tax=Puccinia coronata f. sp. avenae TaxID=200324 RepID=A0A2N5TPK4_9BASI|nr:hypothetical protein PCANC_24308 [Puccinia coronata f. sp. avenae]